MVSLQPKGLAEKTVRVETIEAGEGILENRLNLAPVVYPSLPEYLCP